MEKRELQAGKIVGALWLLWKLTTLDPYMLQMYVRNFDRLPMIVRLDLIGSAAWIIILVLGLMMENRAITVIGCLSVIGFDMWRSLRTVPMTPGLPGGFQFLTYPYLLEAVCFALLLYTLFKPEESKVRIAVASFIAFFSQSAYSMAAINPRAADDPVLSKLRVVFYVLAVYVTGRYFARSMPKELFPNAGKREYGNSGYAPGSGRNSRRGSSLDKEGVWRAAITSDEKQERIRKLKELRDSGIMTKAEYDQMVDKITKQ